jgi:hypothetical protein
VYESGVASVPPASLERTWNVCADSTSPEYDWGEAQGANAAPSSLQANVAPLSLDRKENCADVELENEGGRAVIVVSGGATTCQVKVDAVASMLPAGSIAST